MIEILVCTLIWGASFIAQKLGADHYGPFAVSSYRNLLAAVVLALVVLLRDRRWSGWSRDVLIGGSLGGVCLFAAMLLQQLGIERTTPGVSAFLTANYILLVPVFAAFLGRPAGWSVWAGVALTLVGTYLICLPAGASAGPSLSAIGAGEAWTLGCAALFAVQILVVDRFAATCDMYRFSTVQMAVAGAVALPFVFLPSELSRASWEGFVKGLPSLVWLGVMSSGVAYTLQNLGQAKVPAALASIVMSMEGVFAAIFGWLLLGDVLSFRQLCGCALVLSAVLCPQLCGAKRKVSCSSCGGGEISENSVDKRKENGKWKARMTF